LISHNYAIRPNLLNEFRYGFTHTLLTRNFPIEGAVAIAQLGLQNVDLSTHPTDGGFPSINFSNGTGFTTIGRDIVGPTLSSTKQITDNVTYIKGKHTFRAGADIRWVRFEVPEIETPSDDYGLFTFTGAFTGNTFGDFLLGIPDTTYFAVTGPTDNAGGPQYGVYGQDEWQVNNRLTVNAGLRWEFLPPFVDKRGIQANFDPRTNAILINSILANGLGTAPAFLQSFNACMLPNRDAALPCTNVWLNSQEGLPPGLRQDYMRDFDPRIGLAFRPFKGNKTVLRAGFGIFTVTSLGQLQNNNESNPQAAVHTYQNSIGSNGVPLIQFPQTMAASQFVQLGGGTLEQATDPCYRDPQSAQWNVTLEQELTTNTALRMSYVGMNSYRMNVTVNLNQIAPSALPYVPSPFVDPRAPFQNWGVIYSTENMGGQNYQGMELEATHRMSHGLNFAANYTWAHNLSDAQGDAPIGFGGETSYGLAVLNRFNISQDRGNVAGTRRHRFLLTGNYELPFGQGRQWSSSSRVVNGMLGGWNVNTITLLETGPYLTPTISPEFDQTNTDPTLDGSIVRPDIVGNPIPAHRTASDYFNINAFAPTPAGAARVGNAGVGILEGPGTVAMSAGLAKVMAIHENVRLRFEATFTNVLNHTNYAPPATNVSNPSTFGVLQSAQTAENAGDRTGQLALRLDF
jgi:outer membrane receptor protein involved in Fe transport